MYPSADVLRHAEGGRKGVDGAGGVSEDGELGDLESLADSIYVVCSCQQSSFIHQSAELTGPVQRNRRAIGIRFALANTWSIGRN